MKRRIAAAASVLMISLSALSASAASGYSYDVYGKPIPAPASYIPKQIISGEEIGVNALRGPRDLFVTADGMIYISDTGNNRVLVLDENFALVKEIKELSNAEPTTLAAPDGLFVDANGFLYLCDTGNARALKMDSDGKVIAEYQKPDTKVLSEGYEFKPHKIVADNANGVYVVAYGLYQGIIYYSGDGEFLNFFGSNKVEATFAVIAENMWKKFFTKEQRESLGRTIPTEYSNIFIDSKNFVYTTTLATANSLDEAKKLNALGNNVLRFNAFNTYYPKNNFGDIGVEWVKGVPVDNAFVDICVDDNNIMAVLDRQRCRIFEYSGENDLLSVYGARGGKKGEFLNPSAIGMLNDCFLVLDADKNNITVLEPTDYTKRLKNVMRSYNDGLYEQTITEFEALLLENNNLTLGYKGIGKAYLQKEDYRKAMEFLKKSSDRQGYSEAFREYRKEFIREYFLPVVIISAVVIAAVSLLIKKFRKWLLAERKPS